MTVQQSGTGASSDRATHWHGIDWVRCHREVRRLQARIVKAEQVGKHGTVKALQWLLTHSFSGKALAVKRVSSYSFSQILLNVPPTRVHGERVTIPEAFL